MQLVPYRPESDSIFTPNEGRELRCGQIQWPVAFRRNRKATTYALCYTSLENIKRTIDSVQPAHSVARGRARRRREVYVLLMRLHFNNIKDHFRKFIYDLYNGRNVLVMLQRHNIVPLDDTFRLATSITGFS